MGSSLKEDGFLVTYSVSPLIDRLGRSHPRCLDDLCESWAVLVDSTGSHAHLCMKAGTVDFDHHLSAKKRKKFKNLLKWDLVFQIAHQRGGYQTASKQVNKRCFYPQHVAFSQLLESKSVEG